MALDPGEGGTSVPVRSAIVGMAFGIAGVVGAIALTRTLEHLLFEVTPTDGVTFATVIGMLACVALAGSYVPARRAANIDPVASLRSE